jgi:secreted trypsin-like serine protease
LGKRGRAVFKKLSALGGMMAVLVVAATPGNAITFGHLDRNRHPNVGTIGARFEPRVKDNFCSGTLISPTVFLTAAHCLLFLPSEGIDPDEVFVSFDPSFDQESPVIGGTYFAHPDYGHDFARLNDIGVVVLDRPVTDIEPARLPTANLLGRLQASDELRDKTFTAVGYGTIRTSKKGGFQGILANNDRRYVLQSFNALNKNWLRLSMNPATGDGGTCYGDSGGPHFLGGVRSNLVVAITITGDAPCRATDVDWRLDTPSARAFLDDFVTLP